MDRSEGARPLPPLDGASPEPGRAPRGGRDRALLGAIALLLALPLCCRPDPTTGRAAAGLPIVFSGDEPHFLVLLNSVLDDGDLDLRDEYRAAERGGLQTGAGYRGALLDHHVTYWIGGERVVWSQLFLPGGAPRPGVPPFIVDRPEYPAHPVGLALLLAPILFPLRGTRALEPAALALAAACVIAALVLFARLLDTVTHDRGAARLTLVAVFLGTPLWAYARTLFTEPFLVLCVLGASWAALRPAPRYLAASAFVAAATAMKPQMALLAVPLLALAASRREWAGALRSVPLPTAAVAATLLLNRHMFGSPLLGPYPFYWGNPLHGAAGLLFSAEHGLFIAAPALALAVLGMARLVRQQPRRGALLAAPIVLLFLLTSAWAAWDGGYCFGPRLLVPVIPLLGVGLAKVLDAPLLRRWPVRLGVLALIAASVVLNLVAATHYWYAWGVNPWRLLAAMPALY